MNKLSLQRKIKGLTIVEFTMVVPIFLILMFAIIQGGIAIFIYSHVSHMAKEGVRYAVVRGSEAAKHPARGAGGNPDAPATTTSIRKLLKQTDTLDGSISYKVRWRNSSNKYVTVKDWEADDAPFGANDPGGRIQVIAKYTYIPPVGIFPGIDIEASATGIIHH